MQSHFESKNAQKRRRLEFVPSKAPQSASASIVTFSKPQAPPIKPATNIGLFDPSIVQSCLRWKKVRKVGPGFFNDGNSCYLNSTLQCLLYTPPLAQVLLAEDSLLKKSAKQHDNFQRPVLDIFQALVKEVHGQAPCRALSPRGMVSSIRRVGKQFKPLRQEDAHEYLRQLLDCFAEEVLKSNNLKTNDKLADSTFVGRCFGGQLVNTLACSKCGYISRTYNAFLDLSLELGQGTASVSQAVSAFTRTEHLSHGNEWKCDGCHQKVKATKQLSIAVAPQVLVLHLKRFSGLSMFAGKISKHVSFGLTMSLPFADPRSASKGSVSYDLTAVLVHHGHSTHSGHYIAYIKAPNGQWHEMNDSQVSVVSSAKVLQAQAYLLFYTRSVPVEQTKLSSEPVKVPASVASVATDKAVATDKPAHPAGTVAATIPVVATKIPTPSAAVAVPAVSAAAAEAEPEEEVNETTLELRWLHKWAARHFFGPFRFRGLLHRWWTKKSDSKRRSLRSSSEDEDEEVSVVVRLPLRRYVPSNEEQSDDDDDDDDVSDQSDDHDSDSGMTQQRSDSSEEDTPEEAAVAAPAASQPAQMLPKDKVAALLALSRRGRMLGGEGLWDHQQQNPEVVEMVNAIAVAQRRSDQVDRRQRRVSEWDDLLDQGRTKKVKGPTEVVPQKGNPFQAAAEQQRQRKENGEPEPEFEARDKDKDSHKRKHSGGEDEYDNNHRGSGGQHNKPQGSSAFGQKNGSKFGGKFSNKSHSHGQGKPNGKFQGHKGHGQGRTGNKFQKR